MTTNPSSELPAELLAKLSPQSAQLVAAVMAQPNLYASNAGGPIDISTPDYDLAILREALLGAQICTRLTPGEAVIRMDMQHSAGTSGGWALSDDESNAPVPCASHPDTHTHYVLYC